LFEGVSIAVVTPFSGGEVDEPAFRRLVDHVFNQGVAGIVATGTTGETPTLSIEERERVWRLALDAAAGRGFVVAGTGTNSTRETIDLTRRAASLGVDGCMVVVPYYNKPGPRGLAAHFLTVAEAVEIPLVIYNVPGRTGTNMLPDTVKAVAGHEHIVAIKEASGSLDQATEILRTTDLTVLSGDDSLTLPVLAAGGKGVVSVAGHLAGADLVSLLDHHRQGRVAEAARIHQKLLPLVEALFCESNPAPLKAALCHLGLIENELRLPLVPVGPESMTRIIRVMDELGLAPGGVGTG
jgi:4-hydroxy-tetrahydrodipicolinate synthase